VLNPTFGFEGSDDESFKPAAPTTSYITVGKKSAENKLYDQVASDEELATEND
jgi:hypothetical protein